MRTIWRILVAVILLVGGLTSHLFAGPRERVEQACRNHVLAELDWEPADCEIEFRRYIEPAIDWTNVKLTVRHPRNVVLSGAVTLRVEAVKNGKILRSFPVPIQVTLYDEVVVTTRRLKRNDVIAARDIKVERRAVNLKADLPLDDPAEVIGRRTTRALPTGRPLTASLIEDVPLVKRGQKVTLRFRMGNLLLTARGEAIEDGWEGQPVRVKNLSSKKLVTGISADEGLVDVLCASNGN